MRSVTRLNYRQWLADHPIRRLRPIGPAVHAQGVHQRRRELEAAEWDVEVVSALTRLRRQESLRRSGVAVTD